MSFLQSTYRKTEWSNGPTISELAASTTSRTPAAQTKNFKANWNAAVKRWQPFTRQAHIDWSIFHSQKTPKHSRKGERSGPRDCHGQLPSRNRLQVWNLALDLGQETQNWEQNPLLFMNLKQVSTLEPLSCLTFVMEIARHPRGGQLHQEHRRSPAASPTTPCITVRPQKEVLTIRWSRVSG